MPAHRYFGTTLAVLGLALLTACSQQAPATSVATRVPPTPTATAPTAPSATLAPAVTIIVVTSSPFTADIKAHIQTYLAKAQKAADFDPTKGTYFQFAATVGDSLGAYDQLESVWPSGTGNSGLSYAFQAEQGWQLADQLWHSKFSNDIEPTEPDINDYTTYMNYAGASMVQEVHAATDPVPELRGRHFLPYDPNIHILLVKARIFFDSALAALDSAE